ncbi:MULTISPECIES: HupE/UreJ family protein [Burkholderiaceae]|uniref:HupE/UreJ family protein n=1 Tax=Burkholderia cenocepacia TaxID=95486 RepID=UPI0009819B3A|nr:HupE/UreJ family protein [Burkholderia cenocepacia]
MNHCSSAGPRLPEARLRSWHIPLFLLLLGLGATSFAHGVAQGDKGYIQEIAGVHILPFMYLGAKHMVTGYDHLLFLAGVIFFLYRLQHVALYVSLFALGHSLTLLAGVYFNLGVNAYLIDAIIGFSVVYKALDNLGAFQGSPRFQCNK